ncbi:MAG: hypothetical protein RR295_03360 [Oscillospiraceae bacterium]
MAKIAEKGMGFARGTERLAKNPYKRRREKFWQKSQKLGTGRKNGCNFGETPVAWQGKCKK